MVVFITCKNEKDRIENVGVRVFTTLYINFSDAYNSGVGGGILPKFQSKLS